MNRYSSQELGIIVSSFLRNNSSVVLVQREFRRRFLGRSTPGQTLRHLAARPEEYGTRRDAAGCSTENIAAVAKDVAQNPRVSFRRPIGHQSSVFTNKFW